MRLVCIWYLTQPTVTSLLKGSLLGDNGTTTLVSVVHKYNCGTFAGFEHAAQIRHKDKSQRSVTTHKRLIYGL